MILKRYQQYNSNSNAKKMMTIKKYLCLQKLHDRVLLHITIKNKLRNGMKKQKRTALLFISTRCSKNINIIKLINAGKRYFKYR